MKLGVLDQSPIARGEDAAQALANTTALARRCDELGYHRYWVAEHHASDSLASSSPEILITRLAGETSRIRVGSGGVMLSHYSPFKVAENFRLLETLYPGRIDLGIGRAPGSDGLTAAALAYGNTLGIEYYPAKVKDMIAWVTDSKPLTPAFEKLKVTPRPDTVPEVWMLGSSFDSADYAARSASPSPSPTSSPPSRLCAPCSAIGRRSRRSTSPSRRLPWASLPLPARTRSKPSLPQDPRTAAHPPRSGTPRPAANARRSRLLPVLGRAARGSAQPPLAPDRRHAGGGEGGDRGIGRGMRCRRGDHPHHHPDVRGPAALLRTARRSVWLGR